MAKYNLVNLCSGDDPDRPSARLARPPHRRAQTLGMGPGLPQHPPLALDDGAPALGGDARARADTKPRHPPPAFDNGQA